ncbi:hypothetical protein [Candidatus Pantoea floridensis]|uniref:hypothetical protein n=1 Tax=Candidatus Pantoea floridensis TaxID=1938870 RepID=UPI000BE3AC9F|nr:hypothetical protein [Pantoea floridensis]
MKATEHIAAGQSASMMEYRERLWVVRRQYKNTLDTIMVNIAQERISDLLILFFIFEPAE